VSTSPDRVGPCDGNPTANTAQPYGRLNTLVEELQQRYGWCPELQRDLKGEIFYQFSQLIAGYDAEQEAPLDTYLARLLPERIARYVQEYWDGEAPVPALVDGQQAFASTWPPKDTTHVLRIPLPTQVESELTGILCRLPHRQRLAFVWWYFDKYSLEVIAEQLGTTPAEAGLLLNHARRSICRLFPAPESKLREAAGRDGITPYLQTESSDLGHPADAI